MSRVEILNKIKEVLKDQFGTYEEDEGNRFINALDETYVLDGFVSKFAMDELDKIELIMKLESKFCISIRDEDEEKFVTLGDVVSYVEGRL